MGFSAVLLLLVMAVAVTLVTAGAARLNPPPVGSKPQGLNYLERRQNIIVGQLIDDANFRQGAAIEVPVIPPAEGVPVPGETRKFRTLSDNLLNSLHYYYRLPDDAPPSEFVYKWDAKTGGMMTSDARLFALENDVNYLLSLEIYRSLHPVALFDDDLQYMRQKVDDIFAQDWHTMQEWPLGAYFDLMELYNFTKNEKYLQYAERYAGGDGPDDPQTPLVKARNFAIMFQRDVPRQANPVYFYYAALLADWANRHDETMMAQANALFKGLMEFLYDNRFRLLYRRVSTETGGNTSVRNITETYNTLEQLTAINAILEYYKSSGNPEALSLARAIMRGVYGMDSVLSLKAPEEIGEGTFYGIYTTYDHGREAWRFEADEATMVHILLFNDIVKLNSVTHGEYRDDIEFLTSWLENSGPMYDEYVNGYYVGYEENWIVPEDSQWILTKAAIWMSKALIEDDLYKYGQSRIITPSNAP